MKEARECVEQIRDCESYGGFTDNDLEAIIEKHIAKREARLVEALERIARDTTGEMELGTSDAKMFQHIARKALNPTGGER